jgi:CheY-like chemotaxis protein
MDVQMPGMNGDEATREIRKWKPDIPIIALSANAYEEDIQKSLDAGMNAHLSKPLKLEELSLYITALVPSLSAGRVER